MLNVQVDQSSVRNLRQVIERLAEIPDAIVRVVRFAVNDTASDVQTRARMEMDRVFDRPTPFMKRGVRVTKAGRPATFGSTKGMSREAVAALGKWTVQDVWVYFDPWFGGVPPETVISPHVFGGPRKFKPSERRLAAMKGIRAYMIPTAALPRDSYGNIPGTRMAQILFELGTIETANPYSKTREERLRRTGRTYFIFYARGAKYPIGIAERCGDKVRLVIRFVQSVNYQKRYDFFEISRKQVMHSLPRHFIRLFEKEAIRRGLL
jgi:hypothetical protein